MRQLCKRRRALHEHEHKNAEHIELITSSSSAERSSSEQASLRLQRSESGSGLQGDRRRSRLTRIFIPARLRKTKSLENRSGPNDDDRHSDHPLCISPTSKATRPATSVNRCYTLDKNNNSHSRSSKAHLSLVLRSPDKPFLSAF